MKYIPLRNSVFALDHEVHTSRPRRERVLRCCGVCPGGRRFVHEQPPHWLQSLCRHPEKGGRGAACLGACGILLVICSRSISVFIFALTELVSTDIRLSLSSCQCFFAARRSNYFVSGPIVTVRCIASWGQGTGTDRWAIRIGSFHARQPREAAKHPCSRSSGVTFIR